MPRAIHHFDLWVQDAVTAAPQWDWLLTGCGWERDFADETGGAWKHPDGTYTFLERSSDLVDEPHDRLRPGINHLALTVADQPALDALRAAAAGHGWSELYARSTRTPAGTTTSLSTWRTPKASRSRSSPATEPPASAPLPARPPPNPSRR